VTTYGFPRMLISRFIGLSSFVATQCMLQRLCHLLERPIAREG
jgi:hypothetical protein